MWIMNFPCSQIEIKDIEWHELRNYPSCRNSYFTRWLLMTLECVMIVTQYYLWKFGDTGRKRV